MSWVKIAETSFSAVSSTSIDNCFSSNYNHYLLLTNASSTVSQNGLTLRLRTASINDSSSNYRRQYILADGTSPTAGRQTAQTSWDAAFGSLETTQIGFRILNISNPFGNVRTTGHTRATGNATGNIQYIVNMWSHDLNQSFTGFSAILVQGGAASLGVMTGTIKVYGLRES